MGADHRENREREGDVGCRGNRPTAQIVCIAQVEQCKEQGGYGYTRNGGGHRNHGPSRVPQIAGDEFPFEFQSGDEEEDGQQSIGRPLSNGQVQMERLDPECCVTDLT